MGTGQQYWHDMDKDEYDRRMNPSKQKKKKKDTGDKISPNQEKR